MNKSIHFDAFMGKLFAVLLIPPVPIEGKAISLTMQNILYQPKWFQISSFPHSVILIIGQGVFTSFLLSQDLYILCVIVISLELLTKHRLDKAWLAIEHLKGSSSFGINDCTDCPLFFPCAFLLKVKRSIVAAMCNPDHSCHSVCGGICKADHRLHGALSEWSNPTSQIR